MTQATATALTSPWAKVGVALVVVILGSIAGWGVAALLYPRPDFAGEVDTDEFRRHARQDEEALEARRTGQSWGGGIATFSVIVTYATAEFRRRRRQLSAASTGGRLGGDACLACGKPITPEASKCATCGWSWGQTEAGRAEPGAAADGGA